MNHQDYIKAAQELSKIPGMERSLLRLWTNPAGELEVLPRYDEVANNCYQLEGVWINIDDFSEWSAAKIAANAHAYLYENNYFQLVGINEYFPFIPNNLALVQFINEACKINPQAVLAAIPKE